MSATPTSGPAQVPVGALVELSAAIFTAARVPAAGPKGFGLAVLIDLLCGGLSGGAKRTPGVDRLYAPGDLEAERREQNRETCPVPADVLTQLAACATRLGVAQAIIQPIPT